MYVSLYRVFREFSLWFAAPAQWDVCVWAQHQLEARIYLRVFKCWVFFWGADVQSMMCRSASAVQSLWFLRLFRISAVPNGM